MATHQDSVMAAREKMADGSEPIHTRTRRVEDDRGSIKSNLTAEGRDIHDLEAGDEVEVLVYIDRIEIRPAGGE